MAVTLQEGKWGVWALVVRAGVVCGLTWSVLLGGCSGPDSQADRPPAEESVSQADSASGSLAEDEVLTVIYPRPESDLDARYQYHIELARAALARTAPQFGPFELVPSADVINEFRQHKILVAGTGEVDIMVRPTSIADEKVLTPVRIPVEKGLLGYRVFLIRRQRAEEFAKITSLEQLKTLRLGQGRDWNDVKIYEAQGFGVVTGSVYEGLFEMLVKDRFDYFPRGVDEYLAEVEGHIHLYPDLYVDSTILLHYPFPRYFWVANSDKGNRIHRRLKAGLEAMIADGSFDALFWKYRAEPIREARLSERRVFEIENPFLPKTAPLGNSALWLDPLSVPPSVSADSPSRPE